MLQSAQGPHFVWLLEQLPTPVLLLLTGPRICGPTTHTAPRGWEHWKHTRHLKWGRSSVDCYLGCCCCPWILPRTSEGVLEDACLHLPGWPEGQEITEGPAALWTINLPSVDLQTIHLLYQHSFQPPLLSQGMCFLCHLICDFQTRYIGAGYSCNSPFIQLTLTCCTMKLCKRRSVALSHKNDSAAGSDADPQDSASPPTINAVVSKQQCTIHWPIKHREEPAGMIRTNCFKLMLDVLSEPDSGGS